MLNKREIGPILRCWLEQRVKSLWQTRAFPNRNSRGDGSSQGHDLRGLEAKLEFSQVFWGGGGQHYTD